MFMVFFVLLGFLILFDQYLNIGVLFQVSDIHHETFALILFAFAFGIGVGYELKKVRGFPEGNISNE